MGLHALAPPPLRIPDYGPGVEAPRVVSAHAENRYGLGDGGLGPGDDGPCPRHTPPGVCQLGLHVSPFRELCSFEILLTGTEPNKCTFVRCFESISKICTQLLVSFCGIEEN